MGLPIQQLINDCDTLGMPTILVQYDGFLLRIYPDDCKKTTFGYRFFVAGDRPINNQVACEVSALGDVELIAKLRPDNYILKCEKCYDLVQAETGAHLCSFFWPKKVPLTEFTGEDVKS